MTERDTPITELLSAFADGELLPTETVRVREMLSGSPEQQRFLAELQTLGDRLRELPRYRLEEDFPRRVLREANRCRGLLEQPNMLTDELLSAYVDDELSTEEQLATENWLATDNHSRQLLDRLGDVGSGLRALPKFKLDDDFHRRVLAAAQRARETGEFDDDEDSRSPPSIQPATRPATKPAPTRRWSWFYNVVLTAAAVLVCATAYRAWNPRSVGPSPELRLVLEKPFVESHVLVCEVTTSPKAERDNVLKKLLYQNRIFAANKIQANSECERSLLASPRFARDPKQPDENAPPAELAYLQVTGKRFDQLWRDMLKESRDDLKVRLDLMLVQDERRALEEIDKAARDQFAGTVPSEACGISRLIATRRPLHGHVPVASAQIDLSQLIVAMAANQNANNGGNALRKQNPGEDQVFRILLIKRVAKAK